MTGRPPLRAGDPVEAVVGIGPKTAAALRAIGVTRVLHLLLHLPRRYEDRSELLSVAEAARRGGAVLVCGRLTVRSGRRVRRRLHIADGEVADDSGRMAVRWFNQPWIVERIGDRGVSAFVYGVVGSSRTGGVQLVNPEIHEVAADGPRNEVVPIYAALGPLSGKRLRSVLGHALAAVETIRDPLPEELRSELAVPSLTEALLGLHRPRLPADPERRRLLVAGLNGGETPAHRRLAFDELLSVAMVVADSRARRLLKAAPPITVPARFVPTCGSLLPFKLTAAQRRVVGEVLDDLARPVPMARLLQGDVGSGKTVVAALAILAAVTGGRQAALMAPTELLAEQLVRTVGDLVEAAGHRARLLTGSMPAAAARRVREGLADGSVDLVVGTHSLFQEAVDYADLGLVVIDEQHRFGVTQRQRLLDKGVSPHLLVMTATPIPRSLALTVYGDLELSVIDELPPGRRPVRTEIRDASARKRIWRFLRSEIVAGGQAYIVFPLIEASEAMNAAALETHEAELRAALGDIGLGVLHGRLGRDERERIAERFRCGELGALLATTVIEVGVDVPAASVMVVESAERFGLSQLHQLRGRVGRGDRSSWCILITGDDPSLQARRRLEVLQRTSDGFAVAEADLRQRGPGELTGLRQWGADSFRFADLVRHRDLLELARAVASRAAGDGELDALREGLLSLYPVGVEFSIG